MANNEQVTISQDRITQVKQTIENLIHHFERDIGNGLTVDEFKSIFHPDVKWFDHAFLVCRMGPDAVLGLHQSWRHCNQPFKDNIKAIIPTAEGAVLEQLWVGRCANDIVRPDGTVAVKASGKDFQCHVCMILKISQDGLIERIDEYYNRRWDDGVPENEYVPMRGSSMKAKA